MNTIIKVINIIIHLLTKFHHQHYNGSRSKNNRFCPEGLQAFNTLRRGYNYTHMENGMNHHTRAIGKGCLTSLTFP
jgi:hypothetical protein